MALFRQLGGDNSTTQSHQNDSYEISINRFQVRKINEIVNVIFGLRYGEPSSALRPKLGCFYIFILTIVTFQRKKRIQDTRQNRGMTFIHSDIKSKQNKTFNFNCKLFYNICKVSLPLEYTTIIHH